MRPIDFLQYRSVGDISLSPQRCEWSEFARRLGEFMVVDSKDDCPLYVPSRPVEKPVGRPIGEPGRERLSYRHEANMAAVTLFVLDLDTDAEAGLEAFRDAYRGIEYVIHSTYSHQQPGKGPRYRCVVPLEEPVDARVWGKAVYPALADSIVIDTSRSNPASLFFWAARPSGGPRHYEHERGKWLSSPEVAKRIAAIGLEDLDFIAKEGALPEPVNVPLRAVRRRASKTSSGPRRAVAAAVPSGGRLWPEPDLALCGPDYTEASLAARHEDSLEKLRASGGAHRDAFTLSVTARELRLRGVRTHLRLLTCWMWRMFRTMPGPKSLHMGDTAQTLPSKIARAARDLGVEGLDGVNVPLSALRAVDWAEQNGSAPWPVAPDGSVVGAGVGEGPFLPGADSIEDYGKRNALHLTALSEGGDWRQFAAKVWAEEAKRKDFIPEATLIFLLSQNPPDDAVERLSRSPERLAKAAGWPDSKTQEMEAAVWLALTAMEDEALRVRILPVSSDPLAVAQTEPTAPEANGEPTCA